MKLTKAQLREVMKPMVKQIVQEMMISQLSTIIAEVVKGLDRTVIVEQRHAAPQTIKPIPAPQGREFEESRPDALTERLSKMKAEQKAMLDRIGKTAIGGVNIFEGTTPALEEPTAGDPMAGQDPNDPGVSISGLLNIVGDKWKRNLIT